MKLFKHIVIPDQLLVYSYKDLYVGEEKIYYHLIILPEFIYTGKADWLYIRTNHEDFEEIV